ncbi:hypothetical protein [Pseudoalteromonas byunsanensis]|uniref:hypothetical protein n=1 Tax=Pseudoalteromonas byunsanensis TaxID=327939 RepID=UPI001113A93A|nr:hypothetical protein [Pseudoalteromonas byunsanensis]
MRRSFTNKTYTLHYKRALFGIPNVGVGIGWSESATAYSLTSSKSGQACMVDMSAFYERQDDE